MKSRRILVITIFVVAVFGLSVWRWHLVANTVPNVVVAWIDGSNARAFVLTNFDKVPIVIRKLAVETRADEDWIQAPTAVVAFDSGDMDVVRVRPSESRKFAVSMPTEDAWFRFRADYFVEMTGLRLLLEDMRFRWKKRDPFKKTFSYGALGYDRVFTNRSEPFQNRSQQSDSPNDGLATPSPDLDAGGQGRHR